MGWDTSEVGGLLGTDHVLYLRLRAAEQGRPRILGQRYWMEDELASIICGMALESNSVERCRALGTAAVILGVVTQVRVRAYLLRQAGYPLLFPETRP